MDEQQTPSAPAPSAPPAPVAPSAPPVAPNTLAEFRAQKAASLSGLTETPAEPKAEPQALSESPDFDGDEPEQPEQAQQPQEPPKGPEQDQRTWRWKDPDTGVVLDLRKRGDRRIKRLLEERADYGRRLTTLQQPQQPQYQQEPPRARQPQPQGLQQDQDDPEPQLEQFADEADPYAAHTRALARWEARQEFKSQQASHSRVERMRATQRAITQAQEAYDADLPSVKQRYPDFDEAHTEVLETVGRLPMPARVPLVNRLLTSPVKHDLTHYLGSHPDDLAAVVQARNAYEQGLVLGAIETRVRALVNQRARGPASTHPPAPPPAAPMAPVAGGASPVALPDAKSMNLAQFRANKSKFGMRTA